MLYSALKPMSWAMMLCWKILAIAAVVADV